jgi:16S rRNA (uracil1498-N3)-methyltransferase
VQAGVDRIALTVGPKGGLEDSEHTLTTSIEFRPIRLGPRILRTETAGLAGLTALQVLAGDLR